MPPTDPGLDERVCNVLGWEPQIEWWISRDGGKSVALAFTKEQPARDWLATKQAAGLYRDYAVVRHDFYPPVSTSWELAGKALEDWAKKYPHSAIHLFLRDNVVYCTLDPEDGNPNTLLIGTGPTAPAAIAEAIAALGGGGHRTRRRADAVRVGCPEPFR